MKTLKFSLIDKLISTKIQFMQALQTLDLTCDKLKEIVTPEQTAKYLIYVERVNLFSGWLLYIAQIEIQSQHFQPLGT